MLFHLRHDLCLIYAYEHAGLVDRLISSGTQQVCNILRQILFDIRAGNSSLAKSLSEKSNPAMYQDENPHRYLLSLQN